MIKEDALTKVKGYLTDYLPMEDSEEIEEIVKALSQEPCDDYISRQAAIEKSINVPIVPILKGYNEAVYREVVFVDDIKALPLVAPARSKGKWISHRAKYDRALPVYECSICHTNNGFVCTNYCPNCGAEMEVEDADSN